MRGCGCGAGCKDGSNFSPRNFPAYGDRLSHGLGLRNSRSDSWVPNSWEEGVGMNSVVAVAVWKIEMETYFLDLRCRKF